MLDATGGSWPVEHAVYPGTFDRVTPGHLDIIERTRHLFARITVLVAVNSEKLARVTLAPVALRTGCHRPEAAEPGGVAVALARARGRADNEGIPWGDLMGRRLREGP
jgi:cytidyltransferase-like protein